MVGEDSFDLSREGAVLGSVCESVSLSVSYRALREMGYLLLKVFWISAIRETALSCEMRSWFTAAWITDVIRAGTGTTCVMLIVIWSLSAM